MAGRELRSKRRIWLTTYAPLLVWIGVIFFLSSSNGSMTATSLFIGPLLDFLFPTASAEALLNYHFYTRKLAHVTEYAVLGFLAMRACIVLSPALRSTFAFGLSLLLVVCVAVADEFNQSFNTLRTGSAVDVLLDCIGGIVAISLYIAITYFLEKRGTAQPSNP